jgi:hypothetical protein
MARCPPPLLPNIPNGRAPGTEARPWPVAHACAHGFENVMTRHNRNYVTNSVELRDLPAPAYAQDGATRGRSTCRQATSTLISTLIPPTPHRPPTPHGTSWSSPLGAPRSTYRTSTCTSFQSPDAISPCDWHQFQSAVSVGTSFSRQFQSAPVSVGTVSVGSFSRRSFSRARPGRSSQPLESKSWAPLPLRSRQTRRCRTTRHHRVGGLWAAVRGARAWGRAPGGRTA